MLNTWLKHIDEIVSKTYGVLLRHVKNGLSIKTSPYLSLTDLSERQKELLWRNFIAKTEPIEKRYIKDLKKYFKKQETAFLAGFSPGNKSTWKIKAKWNKELNKMNTKYNLESLIVGGKQTEAALKAFEFDETDAIIIAFLKKKELKFAIEVNAYTTALLKNQIMTGLANEESIAQITARVQNTFGFNEKYRSKRIAQTEVNGAANFGSLESSKQSGVVWGHQWLAAIDDQTRDDHRQLSNEQVKVAIGDLFPLVGIEYPGDSSGDPAQVINCLIAGSRIMIPNELQGMTRRLYKGDLIDIITSNGTKFTATPNHPILTSDGWIALNFLKVGGDIICAPLYKKMSFSNPNKNNIPMTVEDIFNLSSVKCFANSKRVTRTDMQFHGEGINTVTEYIDVITVNRILQSAIKSSIFKPSLQANFTSTDSALCFLKPNSSFAEIGFGSFQSSHGIVSSFRKPLPLFRRSLSHSQIHTFTSVSGLDTSPKESSPDCVSVNMEQFCKSILGCSLDITVDNIISVNKYSFTGHVYNLQTKNGWYIANNNNISNKKHNSNGIITHNCRCALLPLTRKPAGT